MLVNPDESRVTFDVKDAPIPESLAAAFRETLFEQLWQSTETILSKYIWAYTLCNLLLLYNTAWKTECLSCFVTLVVKKRAGISQNFDRECHASDVPNSLSGPGLLFAVHLPVDFVLSTRVKVQ